MLIALTRRSLLRSLGSAALATPSAFRACVAEPPLPSPAQVNPADRNALISYFKSHARELLRPPAGILREPSLACSLPKATYATDLWDWDTLWTATGLYALAGLTTDEALRRDLTRHVRGSVGNFFAYQSAEGRIPMLLTLKDPDPLGCLTGSRPHKENQAKPVLAQLALLATKADGDATWFKPLLPKLLHFYRSWTADNLSSTGLLVWGDDVAIGNDNDPTTFGRPFFSSANPLLNCLYHQDLCAAAEIAARLGETGTQAQLQQQAATLARAMQQHCWDARDHFFYTADTQCVDRRAELIPNIAPGMAMSWSSLPLRIQTFTGFLPLWCGIAKPAQAAALVEHLRNPATLGAAFGVRTLSAQEPMYSLDRSSNPSNWLGPVWIISNYLVWKGLVRNGFLEDAAALARKTVALLAHDLATTGGLNEYYHPDTGAPLSHTGFMDWNLLVLEML